MKTVTIIYGSSTGNTKSVAQTIAKKLAMHHVILLDAAKASAKDIEAANNLILGASTWGSGDLQDDWDSLLPTVKKCALDGKTVALFGLGDGASYCDTFVDGLGTIYNTIKDKNCIITGQTAIEDYDFSESRAVVDGAFVGLPLDEDNESDKTEARIDKWLLKIMSNFK